MSLSGPQVLAALDDALRDIRREEEEIMRKLGRSAERIAKIRESEAALLRQHAQGRIDAVRGPAVLGALEAAQSTGREALRQRAGEMAAGTERLAELDAAQSSLAAERASALAAIDRQQAALRGLSSRIAAAIARDPAYERQQQSAARLRAVAAAARAKARQADIDREHKGRVYRADPLFGYLLQCDYGTPTYKGKGLVARLDGWVAGLTGFASARKHYVLLNALPALLHAHAAQQAARATAADEAIDEIERAAIDAAGGATVRTALAEAQARIAALDARIVLLQDDRNVMTAAQTLLAEADDFAFERAIAALVVALGSADIPALILSARMARPGPDDPLIAQLDDARLRIGEERVDTRDQLARLATLAARRRELEDIEYEFKALKFDDPRSLFREDELVGAELDNFLTGAIGADAYWNSFRRSQAWSVGTTEWGGGVGLPRRGRPTGEPAAASPTPDPFSRPRATAADA